MWVREKIPAQPHQLLTAGYQLHTAGISAAAGDIHPVHGDVAQLTGGAVAAQQGSAIHMDGISHSGAEVDTADDALLRQLQGLGIVGQCHGHIPLNKYGHREFPAQDLHHREIFQEGNIGPLKDSLPCLVQGGGEADGDGPEFFSGDIAMEEGAQIRCCC